MNNTKQICSISNPCGSNGYCIDKINGQWSCQCKFWWTGTLCNQLTKSGKQVIALGCLLVILIIFFYSVDVFHKILSKKKKIKQIHSTHGLPRKYSTYFHVTLNSIKHSISIERLITFILTLFLTIATLLVKWQVLKAIHDETISKYQNELPLYYVPNSICRVMQMQLFNVLTFPMACFVIIICMAQTKRISLMRNKYHGFLAPPIPVDFLSHVDRKFAAVIFAICADELFGIVRNFFANSSKVNTEGVILQYIYQIIQVLIMGIRYYPLLAAAYLNTILSLACGMIYAWLDHSLTIVNQGICISDYYVTIDEYNNTQNASSLIEKLEYFGTGSQLLFLQIFIDIPRMACLAYVSVKFPILLFGKIYKTCKSDSLSEDDHLLLRISNPNSSEMLYVRNLFRSPNERSSTSHPLGRLIPKFIYEWRDDFYFSTRIISVYSSIILLLFFITVQACIQILPKLHWIRKVLQQLFNSISLINNNNSQSLLLLTNVQSSNSQFPIPDLKRPYLLAILSTVIIVTIQLITLLRNIRRNLLQAFRGNDSEVPRRIQSNNVSYAIGNIHFAGYFIGYLVWGYVLIGILSVFIWICFEALLVFRNARLLEFILKLIIPTLLLISFKIYLNMILAKYVFLQHGGRVLSMNNRRLWMIFIYFNLFLDAFLGFISSIIRLIKSVIAGMIYMCRLDYSPLGRKLELSDAGFSAYCGFIHSECVHRHPVMLVFVSHLFKDWKMKQSLVDGNCEKSTIEGHDRRRKSTRAFRKWRLGLLLARNPMIAFFRKAYLNTTHLKINRKISIYEYQSFFNKNQT